ncbi:hypothetical protein EWM64_g3068 [Hericium alpestre]|uniref:Uncharacterized protein n=1 Tax=Hericium alpestre TaxID=135208 RepID=A0A4Z0A3A9_9AGAM|nr:hypothetical protein EWM64_g3068 [Hericium alpestre]
MVVKDIPPVEAPSRLASDPVASSAGPSEYSSPAPPTFEESSGHILIEFDQSGAFIPQGGEEAPPSFTPYEAEYFVAKNKTIITHDPHLNQDGEALYRFLLGQSAQPPVFLLRCKGTHVEHKTRHVTKTDSNGRRRSETEHYTETVTDFEFSIDLGQHLSTDIVQWTVGDDEPVYRGTMVREVGHEEDVRKATRTEKRDGNAWALRRTLQGFPPWISPGSGYVENGRSDVGMPMEQLREVLKSSWTLRQWADDYCNSPKYFKEFIYEKIVYGWNLEALASAVKSCIQSTHYTGDISVKFETELAQVIVRPDNRLARMLSNPWLKFLLIITLIFPFIWLFRRFHSRGGGRWTVGGAAYAMKRWELVRTAINVTAKDVEQYKLSDPRGTYTMTQEGIKRSRAAAAAKKVDRIAMSLPDDVPDYNIASLDGYTDTRQVGQAGAASLV